MALAEIQGSRNERAGAKETEGVMIYVTTDIADVPAVDGTLFFTDEDDTTESGATGRRCHAFAADPEILPGLIFVTAYFKAFVAHA